MLEMLACFVCLTLCRSYFGKRPVKLIGDAQYVVNAVNMLAPVRSTEMALLWDLINLLSVNQDLFEW